MVKSKTERAEYLFAVKEFSDGTPWIMLERRGEGLGVLGEGFLGFDLIEGTSLREAEKIAERLRQSVRSVSYTLSVK